MRLPRWWHIVTYNRTKGHHELMPFGLLNNEQILSGAMMKIKVMLVLSIFLLFLFVYATFEREEREIDLNNQNIHAVLCMDEDGNLETYHINIPEGVNLDYFSEGFCKSLEEN